LYLDGISPGPEGVIWVVKSYHPFGIWSAFGNVLAIFSSLRDWQFSNPEGMENFPNEDFGLSQP
jgi:hypothetical protein